MSLSPAERRRRASARSAARRARADPHKPHLPDIEVAGMHPRALLVALLSSATVLAGCAEEVPDDVGDAVDDVATLPGFLPIDVAELPVFSQPILVDTVRAGGEPVIAITHAGTILVSAHPGFTHYHPPEDQGANPPDEILTPFAAQSYLWRSTDNGATWTHVGLPGMEAGPRSTGFGVSDPEFTVMEDGTICFTDLEALAMSSTSCSMDDGETWMPGNPVAAGAPNDRQWIASYGDEFYFTASYFASAQYGPGDHHLRASTDYGLTWEDRGDVPCSQDLVANPRNGHLIVGCSGIRVGGEDGPTVNGIAVSADGGWTWTDPQASTQEANRTVPGASQRGGGMAEPAVDSAGNVWITYTQGEERLFVAGTPDEGLTWPWVYEVTPHVRLAFAEGRLGGDFVCVEGGGGCLSEVSESGGRATNGTYVWPWISAGSRGRVAVSWIGAFDEVDSTQYGGNWYIFTTYLLGADTATPQIIPLRVTPDPIHEGPICQSGTFCQVSSMQGVDSGDRRLGDFFETTVGPDGYLYGAWSNTYQQPDDVISHPQFAKQVGGLRLIADDELGVFFPTQG
jgi:hypothetical protein